MQEHRVGSVVPRTTEINLIGRGVSCIGGGDTGVVEHIAPARACFLVVRGNDKAARLTIDIQCTTLEEHLAVAVDKVHCALNG